MVEHIPIILPTFSRLLREALVWGSIEFLMWATILTASDKKLSLSFVSNALRRAGRAFTKVASHRKLAVAGIFLAVFLGRLVALPVIPVPPPKIADEFSQLLAADTFASGRLTNPTHPMWLYFETLFVNQKPTYHSMYPPATGLFMAAAQVLTGEPWYGMLFTVAAAAAGICWMLQGWVPGRWALWGSVVFVLLSERIHLTENYLGEGIVILGGALVVGGVPRIVKERSAYAWIWLVLGIALLATSRPYEGIFLASGILGGSTIWALNSGIRARDILNKVAFPVVVVSILVVCGVGFLNRKTTGSFFLAPYELNLSQQHITRPLVWENRVAPPRYAYKAIESFYSQWELNWWNSTRSFPRGTLLQLADKAVTTYEALLWPIGLVVILGSLQLTKSRSRRFIVLAFVFFLVGLSLESYPLLPRYVEPAWGLVLLIGVYGMRYLGTWRRDTGHGRAISRAAAVLVPLTLTVFNVIVYFGVGRSHAEQWYDARQQLSHALRSLPAKQLVLVRYSPGHIPSEEWVYNAADIDRAKVLWARDVQAGESELLKYFADRQVWLLRPDEKTPTLTLLSSDCTKAALPEAGPFLPSCCKQSCDHQDGPH